MNKYGEDGWEYVGNLKRKPPTLLENKGIF